MSLSHPAWAPSASPAAAMVHVSAASSDSGEPPRAPSCPEYPRTGEESPGVVWAIHQPRSRTLWFPRQPLIASLFFTSGLCDRLVVKQTQRWRFVFRFPGKSSWEQHPWECEGGRTGQSEELGCDAVTAKASATAQEICMDQGWLCKQPYMG